MKNKVKTINLNKDTYLHFKDNENFDTFVVNINNCKVKIVNEIESNFTLNLVNSSLSYFFIPSFEYDKKLELNLKKSNADVNIIDIMENENKLNVTNNLLQEDSKINLNVACISAGNKNKSYNLVCSCDDALTTCKMNCFGISKDGSKTTFNLVSKIKKNAFKSKTSQISKILLMDEFSKGVSNPILEIAENDIEASHSSSIGMVDEETIFYLNSRGLDLKQASNMICLGNIKPFLNKLENEIIKTRILTSYKERMV